MKNQNQDKALGELEKKIMEAIWGLEKASVRDVLNKISKNNKPAYTTVMTVMTRLHKKGILNRKMNEEEAYVYKPVKCRANFFSTVAKNIIKNLVNEFGEDVAVAQFLDLVKNSDLKQSKELKQKLKAVMK